MGDRETPPQQQDERDLASEIGVFNVATLQEVDAAVTGDVLNP